MYERKGGEGRGREGRGGEGNGEEGRRRRRKGHKKRRGWEREFVIALWSRLACRSLSDFADVLMRVVELHECMRGGE